MFLMIWATPSVLMPRGWLAKPKSCGSFFARTGSDVKDHHRGQLVAQVEYQKHLWEKPAFLTRGDSQKYSHRYSLPNSILNRLRHWFVHRQKIDGRLAKEN